ncbi:hypothetical protein V5799_008939 [Amblyomma americanum]|uniref:Uncharacterized protein n=1 Tax=Amblyomma americanum TaxID=6943 RepID=A0AAQ4FCI0_AMBAM
MPMTLTLQVVREPALRQKETLFTPESSPCTSSGLKVAVMPAEPSEESTSSEISKTPVKASPRKGKHPNSASAVPASSKKSKLEKKRESS